MRRPASRADATRYLWWLQAVLLALLAAALPDPAPMFLSALGLAYIPASLFIRASMHVGGIIDDALEKRRLAGDRLRDDRLRRDRLWHTRGYDLRATPDRCPACGKAATAPASPAPGPRPAAPGSRPCKHGRRSTRAVARGARPLTRKRGRT